MNNSFPVEPLDQLADQIIIGEVVFFIGAGFSRDSENNTAERLIARLLARFEGMTWYIINESSAAAIKPVAADLQQQLIQMFDLALDGLPVKITRPKKSLTSTLPSLHSAKNIAKLAKDYYLINDWFCEAYACLLLNITKHKMAIAEIAKIINQFELAIFDQYLKEPLAKPIGLAPINFALYENLPSPLNGKALFLDTMGFADQSIMAGEPYEPCQAKVNRSYGTRLKPRHRVLAQWAREGLMPTLLTTNYDLLLEGAYRQSGFVPSEIKTSRYSEWGANTYDRFSTIAGPTEFFTKGSGHRTALIVKIHGCVSRYRIYREEIVDGINSKNCRDIKTYSVAKDTKSWQKYLKSMVFTYREIQNWREDSWSRDYLATLLRTRKMVFAGYSVVDPVLHDTVRSVYEELATQTRQAPATFGDQQIDQTPPAYYFGIASAKEFHGIEILRSASRIHNESAPSLTEHRQYLTFDPSGNMPSLDDNMRWLFHRTYRKQQAQALNTSLRRTATMIFRHPCAATDIAAIQTAFDALINSEVTQAKQWQLSPKPNGQWRQQFEQLLSWTEDFQVKLLREFILAEALQHYGGLSTQQQAIRQSAHYFPILDRPEWAAWGVVIELALRKAINNWQNDASANLQRGDEWLNPTDHIAVGAGDFPQVLFGKNVALPAKTCLTIRLDGNGRPGLSYTGGGYFKKEVIWNLYAQSIPWFEELTSLRSLGHNPNRTPDAGTLWRWALAQSTGAFKNLKSYLE